VGGTRVGRPHPNLPHVPRRGAHVGHTWRSCGSSGHHVPTANRYAKRSDLGDETGEHFGAHSGAELFPKGAFPGAVRLPSIRINLHQFALEWAPQLLGG
jgi:hypothetical protein